MIKPSQRNRKTAEGSANRYDELVIRWNDIPANTSANLYFPDLSADEILQLEGNARPGRQLLTKVDANTIACAARGTTYIPVPSPTVSTLPGLLTLQLPLTVISGQQFRVDVQQHSGVTYQRKQSIAARGDRRRGIDDYTLSLRRVLGAFRMTVLVKHGEPLIGKAVRNLAVLKFIQQAIPAADPWSAVFVRYIGQLSGQLSGLNIDPTLIPPSQDDSGIPGHPHHPQLHCFTGKISEIQFDCFGDFFGFVLESCETAHHFKTAEKGIGELVLRACKDRLLITVKTHGEDQRIRELIVQCTSKC